MIERRAVSPITPLRLFNDRNHVVAYIARLLARRSDVRPVLLPGAVHAGDPRVQPARRRALAFLPLTACLFVSSQTGARLPPDLATDPRRDRCHRLDDRSLLDQPPVRRAAATSSIAGPLVLIGLGNGLAFVALTALALSNVEPRDGGAAAGLVNVTQQIGAALGLALLVTIFNTASHASTSAPQAFVDGTNRAYLVAAALLAAVVVISAVVLRTRPDRRRESIDLEAEILELEMEGSETGV